ncbi:Nn.00g069820.m01.CDS01 [Neocucurbitaria sp. VM-36]
MASVATVESTKRRGGLGEATRVQYKRFKSRSEDFLANTKHILRIQTDKLCSDCKEIPFHECLPKTPGEEEESSQERGALIFYKSLSKILNNRGICRLCNLLIQSICQEEYDILKADHIKDFLPDDPRYKNLTRFSDWIDKNNYWKREWLGGAGLWPFGYAIDRTQAANSTVRDAKKLFEEAENRDTKLNKVEDMYGSSADAAVHALNVAQGGMTLLNSVNMQNRRLEKVLGSMQVVTGQFALLQNKKRKRLPCIFMFRVYRKHEEKAGALSVRVYGHGRAPLAPLKEICHFSLRFEGDGAPRQFKQQIWYGRKLKPRIEIPFFKDYIMECESTHVGDGGCARLLSEPPSTPTSYESATFRLVNVKKMCIERVPFRQVIRPGPPRKAIKYVALSYRWGILPLLKGWTQEDNPNREAPPSQRFYYRNEKLNISIWDRPDATKLTSENEGSLRVEGSLARDDVVIPQTISDAIDVVRELDLGDLDYLWVDQLCTIQFGNDDDKIANVKRMDQIYNHALFTIVAADGSDANAGLKGMRADHARCKQIIEGGIMLDALMFLPTKMHMDFQQWEERAWCFQEKVLSRRLLVFAGGFAVWHCRGGVWREDVNAKDGDEASVSFPWLHLLPNPHPYQTAMARAGLKKRVADESVRLYRLPAMKQYIEAVEDLSKRTISNSWDILNAFKGLSNVLAGEDYLNSPFRQGLPTYFLDVALLWQPKEPARRRQHDIDDSGNVYHYAPPSWSCFGWESAEPRLFSGAKGALVEYEKPYDIGAERSGLVLYQCEKGLGEERIRPRKGTFWGIDESGKKLRHLGMFSIPGMSSMGFKDWESGHAEPTIPPNYVSLLPLLNQQHLVLQTELAVLTLGRDCWRTTITTSLPDSQQQQHTISFQDAEPTPLPPSPIPNTSHEYWLDTPAHKSIGVAKLDAGYHALTTRSIKAVVLSEAQYLGNEATPDVLGYPLYNIMLVRRVRKESGYSFAERIGVGKVYKYAWREAEPVVKVVVLE